MVSHFCCPGTAGLPRGLYRFVREDAQSRHSASAVYSILFRVRHCRRLDVGVGSFSIRLDGHESDFSRHARATRACCVVHSSRGTTRALRLSSYCSLERFHIPRAVGTLDPRHRDSWTMKILPLNKAAAANLATTVRLQFEPFVGRVAELGLSATSHLLMKYAPGITSARTKGFVEVGGHTAALLTDIVSVGPVEYLYVVAVFPRDSLDPCFYVASEIGRASCRERVKISVVAVSL